MGPLCYPVTMGRTIPSATITFYHEQEKFSTFRRALRRSDQLALDELFVYARQHIAEAGYAADPLPMYIFLLSMLLEEHKEVMRLRALLEDFQSHTGLEESVS